MANRSDVSTPQLVMEVADDLRMLVRKELELARQELMEGITAKAKGAALIGGAVLALFPGLIFLAIAFALWLSNRLGGRPVWGFLIVGLAIFALVGILVLVGVRKMKSRQAGVTVAVESVKEDVRWAKGHLKR